jgi:hypothetical protein
VLKSPLREEQMPDAVAIAQGMANKLILRESRGPGDMSNAMRRLESKYGIPYSFLWSLRYRPPQDILMGAWQRLVSAYEIECERQKRLYDAELANTKALKNAANSILVRAALALDRAAKETP